MFDHAHFLFACTEFTRIVNFPLRTAEERMSYQAVRMIIPAGSSLVQS
jgi:hypothetical protein